jgi:hypothetical protein
MWRRAELRGHYRVRDLSIGGCQLVDGPAHPIGEEVDVLLHLAHRDALMLHGRVARIGRDRVGLRFDAPSPRAEDYIQELVFDALVHNREPQDDVVLVVQPHSAMRTELVRSLRELGMRPVGVSTALDAVQLLVEQGEHVRAAFIDAHASSIPSQEIVEFLAHNHPRVRRVLVGELKTMDPALVAHATGEVDALLEPPVRIEAVRRLLVSLECPPHDADLS